MAVDLRSLSIALSQQADYRSPLNEHGVNAIQRMPNQLAAVLRVQRDANRKIDADGRLSDAGKQQDRQEVKDWARVEVDFLNTVFEREAEGVTKGLPPVNAMSAEQQAAFDAKAPRLWERTRHQLDAGVELSTVIRNADRDTLQVIEEEIGAYHLAKNPSDERLANLQTQAARELIDQHRPAVLTLEEAKLFGQRNEIEAGINNVTGAFNWARLGLDDKNMNVFPAFERGKAVYVHG